MKFFSLTLALSLSLTAFAQKKAEFDEGQEKSCYEEARRAGCVKGTAAADPTCARMRKAKLSKLCHQILGIQ